MSFDKVMRRLKEGKRSIQIPVIRESERLRVTPEVAKRISRQQSGGIPFNPTHTDGQVPDDLRHLGTEGDGDRNA